MERNRPGGAGDWGQLDILRLAILWGREQIRFSTLLSYGPDRDSLNGLVWWARPNILGSAMGGPTFSDLLSLALGNTPTSNLLYATLTSAARLHVTFSQPGALREQKSEITTSGPGPQRVTSPVITFESARYIAIWHLTLFELPLRVKSHKLKVKNRMRLPDLIGDALGPVSSCLALIF